VAKENNRGSIASVQKAGRVSERVKKRVAKEQARENRATLEKENQVIKWRGGYQKGLG
jgi:hypothetical protein